MASKKCSASLFIEKSGRAVGVARPSDIQRATVWTGARKNERTKEKEIEPNMQCEV